MDVGSETRMRAEQRLRDAIIDGEMAPGHRLVDVDLVGMLCISRSAVRLVIDTLVTEGLAERVPNRGARVRVVTTEQAVAMTECRMVLEVLLARRAADRITEPEIVELRAALERVRAAVQSGDVVTCSRLVQQLYAHLHTAARQPVAAALLDRLQAQLVTHQFRLSLRPGRSQVSLAELTALVGAIADRDGDQAAAAVSDHFRGMITALRAEPA